MSTDLRQACVSLLDVADSAPDAGDIPFPLRGRIDNLREAVLADKERRDAACVTGGPHSPECVKPADRLTIPADHFADSPEGRFKTAFQEKLFTARQFYAALISCRPNVLDNPPGKPMRQCYEHADQFVSGFGQFMRRPPEAVQPHPTPPPPRPDFTQAFLLLRWLADHGPMPAGEVPVGFRDDLDLGSARWVLRREGLAEFGPADQFALTDKGRRVTGTEVRTEAVPAGRVSDETLQLIS